jgi:hypothetical protein
MRFPGRALWVLVAMNSLFVVVASPRTMSAHREASCVPPQVDVKSWFEPAEPACPNVEGSRASVDPQLFRRWITNEKAKFGRFTVQETNAPSFSNIDRGFLAERSCWDSAWPQVSASGYVPPA